MRQLTATLLAISVIVPANASAHGGGLDRYGCHNDRKRGGYHCHRAQSSAPAPTVTQSPRPTQTIKPQSLVSAPVKSRTKPGATAPVEGVPVSAEEAAAIDEANQREKERLWREGASYTSELSAAEIQRKNQIWAIQTALTKLGYKPGPADGVMRAETELAIAQYKVDHQQTYDVKDYENIFNVVTMAAWKKK